MDNSPKDDDGMHREVDWMVRADRYILDYMCSVKKPDGSPAIQSPSVIAMNIDYSRQHVGGRCVELSERGLLERLDRGKYRITEVGLRYRELTTGELNALEKTED